MSMNLNRRHLLQGSAAVAAASLLPDSLSAASPASTAPSRIRFGVASYTFRTFDSARLIESMKRLRCKNLNLKDMHLKMESPDKVAVAAQAYRDAGFTITGVGNITFASTDPADMRAKFDYAKAAGAPLIVCAPTKETLPGLEKLVKEYNIKLAIHNHGPEDKHFPSPLDVLAAVKNLDTRIGLCIDVGHTLRAGTDPVAAIHAAGARLYDMHMKDLAQHDVKESQVAVGEGILPVPEIFKALLEIRYPGCVDLEYEIVPNDPMPGVLESFAYMRGVVAGMGHEDWRYAS